MTAEYDVQKTWKHAKRHLKRTHRGFLDLIEKRVEELNPSDEDRRRFQALCGLLPMEGPLRHSDLIAHFYLAKYVAREVRDLRRVSPDLNFYFLTLLADEGIMSDRKPRFARRFLAGKADKAMRKAGLEGLFVVEVQALMNWPGKGNGRTLLGHVHILGWKHQDAPNNSEADIRRELGYEKRRRNLAWRSRFGADPIEVLAITPELGCPSYWAAYLLKLPHDAKNVVELKREQGSQLSDPKIRMMSTTNAYRAELGMRLFELFGQMPLSAAVGGVGAGFTLLTRSRNRLKLRDERRLAKWKEEEVEWVRAFNERKFWKRTHKRRRVRYRPFFIDGPTVARRATRRRL